jgi:hypothetical protein
VNLEREYDFMKGTAVNNLMIALALGCFFLASPVWAEKHMTIVYSGNLNGELEPCGCTEEGNLGGIKRRATLLKKLRRENPNLFTVSAGGLLSSDGPDDRLKSEYILKGFSYLDYDAIGVQWRDLVYGPEFVFSAKLPWVISNWKNNTVPAQRVIKHGGQQLAFFNWLDPADSPMRQMQGQHSLVQNAPSRLLTGLQRAKQRHQVTLLVSTLKAEQLSKVISLNNVDILIERAAYENYGQPRKVGKTLVLTPGSRGMRLGKLDLEIQNERIKSWKNKVLAMPTAIADAPELAAWYKEYNARVKANYLKHVELRKKQESGKGPYVGEEVCATCHAEQHKIWAKSLHATAYEKLEDVNKAFDPECIKCHTVGYDKPGGFIDINLTGNLIGVQCESCHGAGREHAETKGTHPVPTEFWPPKKICAQCHVHEHSPSFKFETYWPKVAH